MNRVRDSVVLLVISVSWSSGQQKPLTYKGQEEKLPAIVAPQPIAFSHKKHVAAGQTCLDCHPGARQQEQAGLPSTEFCLACHETIKAGRAEIKKLAAAQKHREKLEWVRVYRLPDFVFFSHANHTKAAVICETCHGPVGERDVVAREVSTGMVACMNCHAVRKAPNGCSACHQLGH